MENKKIYGNVVGVPNPKPDWYQTDKTKADYVNGSEEYRAEVESKIKSSNKSYRKIREFVVGDNGVVVDEFSTDQNTGKPFCLDGVVVDIYSPTPITTSSIWACKVNEKGSNTSLFFLNNINATSNGGSAEGEKRMKIKAERLDDGCWWNVRWSKWQSSHLGASYISNYTLSTVNYIYNIELSIPDAPIGTKVTFYGKEATVQ